MVTAGNRRIPYIRIASEASAVHQLENLPHCHTYPRGYSGAFPPAVLSVDLLPETPQYSPWQDHLFLRRSVPDVCPVHPLHRLLPGWDLLHCPSGRYLWEAPGCRSAAMPHGVLLYFWGNPEPECSPWSGSTRLPSVSYCPSIHAEGWQSV